MKTKNLFRLIHCAALTCINYMALQGCSNYEKQGYTKLKEDDAHSVYKTKDGHEVQLDTSIEDLCITTKIQQQSKRAFVKYNTPEGFNCTKELPIVISEDFDTNHLLDPSNVGSAMHIIKNSNGEQYLLLKQIDLKGGSGKGDNNLWKGVFESKESRDQRTIDNLTGWSMPQQPSYNPVREGLRSNGLDYANLGGNNIILTQYNPFGSSSNSSNQSSGFGGYNSSSTGGFGNYGSSSTGGFGNSNSSSTGGFWEKLAKSTFETFKNTVIKELANYNPPLTGEGLGNDKFLSYTNLSSEELKLLASLDVPALKKLPKEKLEIALNEKAKAGNIKMREKVLAAALKHEGSMEWSVNPISSPLTKIRDFVNDGLLPTSFKCNKFVYDILKECGIDMSKPIEGSFYDHPYLAKDWANKDLNIPGWRVLGPNETPEPGDVIAIPNIDDRWSSGHMGIVYKNGLTISASTAEGAMGRITINDWGFKSEHVGKVVIRRYIHAGELHVGKGGTPITK